MVQPHNQLRMFKLEHHLLRPGSLFTALNSLFCDILYQLDRAKFRERWKMTEKKIFVEPELIKYEESLDEVTLMPFTSTPKWSDVYRDRLNTYLSDTVYKNVLFP